jgi:hypothetical protein
MNTQETVNSSIKAKHVLLMFTLLAAPSLMVSQTNIMPAGLKANATSSMTWAMVCFSNEAAIRAPRTSKILSIKGKYAFIKTSSEEFALRKQSEIDREG